MNLTELGNLIDNFPNSIVKKDIEVRRNGKSNKDDIVFTDQEIIELNFTEAVWLIDNSDLILEALEEYYEEKSQINNVKKIN